MFNTFEVVPTQHKSTERLTVMKTRTKAPSWGHSRSTAFDSESCEDMYRCWTLTEKTTFSYLIRSIYSIKSKYE